LVIFSGFFFVIILLAILFPSSYVERTRSLPPPMTISLTQLDPVIRSRSLLTHYFYKQKWNMGELTKEELVVYAKEYFHLAKRVPGIVSRVKQRAVAAGRTDITSDIEKNIEEETQHVDLWKRFAKSLGVSDAEMEAYIPSKTTQDAVSDLEKLAEGSLEDGVTAMYAMELSLPEIAKTKKEGLCEFYGLTSKDAHVYFDEHLNEEEHFSVWRKVEVDPVRAFKIAKMSLHAQHKVLDGVCEMCGFCISC